MPLSHIDRILENVNHGITAETSAASATSVATKAAQAFAATRTEGYGRNVAKTSQGDLRDNPRAGGFGTETTSRL